MFNPPPLTIGTLTIPFPVLLAPMAGYTDRAFRSICLEMGAGAVLTEMVNAMGIVRRQPRTLHYLETTPHEGPVGAHIYGSHPNVLAEAASFATATGRFAFIDLNAGCPVPKIMRRGDGAGLMRDPAALAHLVHTIASATRLPLTVKTRIGLSPAQSHASEIAHAIEAGGAAAISIHGRFAKARHTGVADWETIARIKSERRIPVIGNGGVNRPADAERMMKETGVDGVMIGRAAIGNPWIFREIRNLWAGISYTPPSTSDRRAMMREHLRRLKDLVALESAFCRKPRRDTEACACMCFRPHIVKYLRGFDGLSDLTAHFQALESEDQLFRYIDAVFVRNP